jgi:hypothetical protein
LLPAGALAYLRSAPLLAPCVELIVASTRPPKSTRRQCSMSPLPMQPPNGAVRNLAQRPPSTLPLALGVELTVALTRLPTFTRQHCSSSPLPTQPPKGVVLRYPPWPPSRRFPAQTPPCLELHWCKVRVLTDLRKRMRRMGENRRAVGLTPHVRYWRKFNPGIGCKGEA